MTDTNAASPAAETAGKIDIFNVNELVGNAGTWLVTSGLKIFVILIFTLVAIKAIQIIVDQIFGRLFKNHKDDVEIQKRTDTLKAVTRNIAIISLAVIALIMILGELGIAIGPILTAAGVLGIAVGFGAQTLVKDVINGFFILLDDQIRVGDVVDIAGKSGLVECVTLRMTTLRDVAGNVHFVRNGEINVVTNMTKEWSRYVFDVGVAYRENVDEVIDVIKQVDEDLRADEAFRDDILDPIEILGLDQFADSAIIIKARTRTRPSRQWAVGREFNRRLKKKFDELKIEIPFPHVTLYMGQGKDGSAAALNVAMQPTNKG
ncbi:MAG: mechanosensitive ion channel family protein [Planctomycetales bacterium]|nr:mechanosensitive ion channel family protein [Planctomycetales bacterium]